MADLAAYKTNYLFLLVGRNPLPNYVSALLLAKDEGTIVLLHTPGTDGTGKVANNLRKVINTTA
jgi:hypothetical protein